MCSLICFTIHIQQPKQKPKAKVSTKDWILRYAEEYDEEDEENMDWLDDEEQRELNAKKDPVGSPKCEIYNPELGSNFSCSKLNHLPVTK